MTNAPKPFEAHESGAYLHGTKADLAVGDLLVPGRESNYAAGRIMNHVYVTQTLDAAAWGAEMAGAIEDDPNVTDKKMPGNPSSCRPCGTAWPTSGGSDLTSSTTR